MIKEQKLKQKVIFKQCLVLLFFVSVSWLSANETGRLSLTFQNQSFKTIDPYGDYLSSLNSIYLNLWQGLGKGSSFNFSINYYFDRGINQVASYNLGLQQIPLGKFKMNVDFGTISYPLTSLPFFGSFNPNSYRGLKGGKITLTSHKTDFILFGGQLYEGFGYRNEKSKLYGVRAIYRPNPRWTLGTGWLKILDMLTGDFLNSRTADYDVFSLDSSIMPVKNLYLLGDFRYIIDQGSRDKNSFSAKTGTYYHAGKVSLEIFYSYISPHYPSLGTIFIQDHRGITLMGQYRPFSWLAFFGGFDTFNEQLRNSIGQPPPGSFLTYRFGSTVSAKKYPQLSFNYNKSIKELSQEGAGGGSGTEVETKFDMLFVSLSKQTRRFFWSIYYNTGKFTKPKEIAGNYNSNRIFLNLRWTYPTGHYIYFTGGLDQSDWLGTTLDNKNYNVQLGANVRMASNLQCNIQGDYAVDKYAARVGENRRFAIGGGIIYRFKPLKVNLSLRYQYAQSEASLADNSARYAHQVFFSINRDFTWGNDSSGMGALGRATGGSGTGKIKGSVFIDINQNDLQEQGEEGLADIYILVDNYRAAKTDKNGRFAISPVYAGPHQISLDLRNLPAFYEAGLEKTEIIIKKKETAVANLTVIPVGLLTGQVILDSDENNIADKEEPFLKDIRIDLFKEDQLIRWELTNSKGVFTFDNLRPGTYTIKVDEESVFEKYNGIDKAVLQVTVKPWEEKKGIIILLNQYKKDRVKKILDY